MKLPRYQLAASKNLMTFEFISDGPKGKISKLVQFTPTNLKNVYNLSFGDKNQETGEIDDKIISNNADAHKVLATVVASIYAFTDKYPDCWIYATGSSQSRTRLYRMGITKYFRETKKDFHIYGETGEDWEVFNRGKEYSGFLIQRK
jgi:hypothetical protein